MLRLGSNIQILESGKTSRRDRSYRNYGVMIVFHECFTEGSKDFGRLGFMTILLVCGWLQVADATILTLTSAEQILASKTTTKIEIIFLKQKTDLKRMAN